MKRTYYLESASRLQEYIGTDKFKRDSEDLWLMYAAKIVAEAKNTKDQAYKFAVELLSLHKQLGRVDKDGQSKDDPNTVNRYLDLYLRLRENESIPSRASLKAYISTIDFQNQNDPILKYAAESYQDILSPQVETAGRLIACHHALEKAKTKDEKAILHFKYQYLYDQFKDELKNALGKENVAAPGEKENPVQQKTSVKQTLLQKMGKAMHPLKRKGESDNESKSKRRSVSGLEENFQQSVEDESKRASVSWVRASVQTGKKGDEKASPKEIYDDFVALIEAKMKAIEAEAFIDRVQKLGGTTSGLPEKLRAARHDIQQHINLLKGFVENHSSYLGSGNNLEGLVAKKVQRLGGKEFLESKAPADAKLMEQVKGDIQAKLILYAPPSNRK